MTYYRLRNEGNRIAKAEEAGCCVFDPFREEWISAKEQPDQKDEISEEEAKMYLCAVQTAHRAHTGQKDKAGADYINHPLTVSSFTEGPFVSVIAALLHDVVEDTEITLEDLRNMGFSEAVVTCVDACTRREEEKRSVYLERLAECTDAVYVKLADLRHNSDLSRIPHPTQRDFYRVEKYRRETEYLKEILQQRKNEAAL